MSPTRRDVDYLADAAEAMRRVVAYTDNLSFEAFEVDTKTQDAVIRNLQVLGEAVKRLVRDALGSSFTTLARNGRPP